MNYAILFLMITSITLCKLNPEIKTYAEPIPQDKECFLVADIGGTKSNIGIFEVEDDEDPVMLISFHGETKEIGNFTETINQLLKYLSDTYGITIQYACIGAPGVATKNKDYSSVHGMFDIKASELIEKTSLQDVIIVNDLFIAGHGISSVSDDNLIPLYGKKAKDHDNHAIRGLISAGSGIGSCTMSWDSKNDHIVVHPGEAGMLEFAPTNKTEYELANLIKHFYNRDAACWANVASGSGITRIYTMLKLKEKYKDSLSLDKHDASIILEHPEDELCKATTDLFFKFFGRFARNYTWSTLPYGGLYIVGGVATKHAELFEKNFAQYYEDARFQKQLREIPVYLVKDPYVGLYGAINYLVAHMKEKSTQE